MSIDSSFYLFLPFRPSSATTLPDVKFNLTQYPILVSFRKSQFAAIITANVAGVFNFDSIASSIPSQRSRLSDLLSYPDMFHLHLHHFHLFV